MITVIICLLLLTVLLGVAFKLSGVLLRVSLWLFIFLPVGLFLWILGIACCCTLLLIPVGAMLFRAGARVIVL